MRPNLMKAMRLSRQRRPAAPGAQRRRRARRPWGLIAVAVLLGGAAVLALQPAPPPLALAGRAVAADGDSLRLGTERIRLLGIDAPELGQICRTTAGARWDCGRRAQTQLASLVRSATVLCRGQGHDRYGRVLASCTAAGIDLAAAQVAVGLALADGRYEEEEGQARMAAAGIWGGPFERPREWRRANGETSEAEQLSAPRPSWFERFASWIGNWLGELTGASALR